MGITRGTIIKGIAGFYYVHDGQSCIYECKARGIFRNIGLKPLPGDRVTIELTDEGRKQGNIISVEDRTNTLIRPAVANIDQAVLTFSLKDPAPSTNLIDRLLVYYALMDIPVVIAFGKTDLDDGALEREYGDIYRDCGCRLIFFNCRCQEGPESIREVLSGKTSVITGPSGAGKSTLTNALVPGAEAQVGELSAKLGRGRNTTRHTELFCVMTDTFIIDTPGFTSFMLEGVTERELKAYYPEFLPYAGRCRFDDCVHVGEKECAVKSAVTTGEIHKNRYDNYRMIYSELKSVRKY